MRSTTGMLLALLAFGLVWPSGVQAGCLYSHGAAPGRGVAHLDRLALAGALAMPMDEAVPPTPVPPCSGMRCSNDPAPAPPSAPAVVPTAEQWGYLARLANGPDLTSSPLCGDGPAVRPRHRGASLFRPPR